MTTKITSITSHTTGEGERITYTYSEIDEDGNIVKQNEKKSRIIIDEDVLKNISAIKDFLYNKHES